MKNIQLFSTDIDLSNQVTIPANSTGDEQILINSFSIAVPSTITVRVEYSTDGVNFNVLHSGISNTEKSRGGVLWRKMRFTKTGGSTTTASINYAQGISLSPDTDAPLSSTITNIPANSTTADAESNPSTSRIGSLGYSYNGSTWDRNRSAIVSATSTFTGIQNVFGMGRYNASAPTLTDGQVVVYQVDVNGNMKNVEQKQPTAEDNARSLIAVANKPLSDGSYTLLPFVNLGANVTLNIKASAAHLYSCYGETTNAAKRYLQFFNTTTTPTGGNTPVLSFLIPASSSASYGNDHFGLNGQPFPTGLAYGVSTTPLTYTAATASEQVVMAKYY